MAGDSEKSSPTSTGIRNFRSQAPLNLETIVQLVIGILQIALASLALWQNRVFIRNMLGTCNKRDNLSKDFLNYL